jgi:hypothetical protein
MCAGRNSREHWSSIDVCGAGAKRCTNSPRRAGPAVSPSFRIAATKRHTTMGKAPREGPFRQRACKPDPVASGHLSRRDLSPAGAAERLLRPTWTSPSRVDDPAWPCTGRGLPGRRVTATPVRSYRTFSPLPVRDSRAVAPSAVCFCGTFPRVSPGGRYPPPCPVVSGLSSKGLSLPSAVRSARTSDGSPSPPDRHRATPCAVVPA